MADPLDGSWGDSDVNVTPTNLDGTTHGSGTTAERTAITSWPANRPFFDTDLGQWFSNTHVSAPSSVTWTAILARQPQKRRALFSASLYQNSSVSANTRRYFSPIGHSSLSNEGLGISTTALNIAIPITAENITVKRVRINIINDGMTSDTFDVGLYNATDTASVHSFDGQSNGSGQVVLDSGDISQTVDGADELCWYYENNTSATAVNVEIAFLCEYEYDDIY